MTEKPELTEDELEREDGEELPSREAMSWVGISGDPSEYTLPPIPLPEDLPVESS